jgi:hypothetical protein
MRWPPVAVCAWSVLAEVAPHLCPSCAEFCRSGYGAATRAGGRARRAPAEERGFRRGAAACGARVYMCTVTSDVGWNAKCGGGSAGLHKHKRNTETEESDQERRRAATPRAVKGARSRVGLGKGRDAEHGCQNHHMTVHFCGLSCSSAVGSCSHSGFWVSGPDVTCGERGALRELREARVVLHCSRHHSRKRGSLRGLRHRRSWAVFTQRTCQRQCARLFVDGGKKERASPTAVFISARRDAGSSGFSTFTVICRADTPSSIVGATTSSSATRRHVDTSSRAHDHECARTRTGTGILHDRAARLRVMARGCADPAGPVGRKCA